MPRTQAGGRRGDGEGSIGKKSSTLKILVVSWYFPPFNTMGALRIGKLCKYLHGGGHDVRVLCCSNLPYDRTLPQEFPEERVVRTPYRDVNAPFRLLARLRGGGAKPAAASAAPAPADSPDGPPPSPGLLRRTLRALSNAYVELSNLPDGQIGWLPSAVRAGRRMLDGWTPDVVFASAPPFTGLLIGRSLARRHGIPWVVEYRDRHFEDPYALPSDLRHRLDQWMEDRWMSGVSGIVTVSEPWAEDYVRRYGLPVETVYNGFDPDEFPVDYPRRPGDPHVLRIVYTGILYPDRRDPSPLFAAIRSLGEEATSIRVEFYGANKSVLREMVERHGVVERVDIFDRIPYRESLDVQMNADILLLLQWNDPRERGNVPGKVFEYVAARRPVLGIGFEDGVPARILRERGIGIVLNDPPAIAAVLRRWIAEKRAQGQIPLTPLAAREGLSRPDQYRRLEAFLARMARPRS